jgi:hypothetical protein
MGQYDSALVASFERHGEEWVRGRILTGEWGPPDSTAHSQATAWLAIKDAARRDANDARNLRIALIACIAAIAAAIFSAIAIIIQIFKP